MKLIQLKSRNHSFLDLETNCLYSVGNINDVVTPSNMDWKKAEQIFGTSFEVKDATVLDDLSNIKDIPKNLVPYSELRGPEWIMDSIKPVAYLLETEESFRLLFDRNDIDRMRKTKPNRYESFDDVPKNLYSKTRMKKEHGIDVDKEGLKVVADYLYYLPNAGYRYVPLYRYGSEHQGYSTMKQVLPTLFQDKIRSIQL